LYCALYSSGAALGPLLNYWGHGSRGRARAFGRIITMQNMYSRVQYKYASSNFLSTAEVLWLWEDNVSFA